MCVIRESLFVWMYLFSVLLLLYIKKHMALDVGFHAHILYRMICVDAVVAHINRFFFAGTYY